ncbi:MAG: hypothetical protein MN733_10765 [Nitrososphaera sp.]|nr:hypothetical protein [Nitrososphaera sp.]
MTENTMTDAMAMENEKFRELASSRLPRALLAIHTLEKLGGYRSSPASREFVLGKLKEAVVSVAEAYASDGRKKRAVIEIPR